VHWRYYHVGTLNGGDDGKTHHVNRNRGLSLMATSITVMPAEKGTAKVTVASFKDESGTAVTPIAITWTLTDRLGNVINSRSAVSVTPATSVSFLLTGNDLAIGINGKQRVITIAATYNSTLGSGLVARAQAYFTIEDMVALS
jgi:predicted pyridoxine 5'-phosphate oxidase superfamily flavin-nucleotide-binding protein